MKRGGKIANKMKSNPLIAADRLSRALNRNGIPQGGVQYSALNAAFIKSVMIHLNKLLVSHWLPVTYAESILIYVKVLWDSWETLKSPKNEFILLGGVDKHGLNAEIILRNSLQ